MYECMCVYVYVCMCMHMEVQIYRVQKNMSDLLELEPQIPVSYLIGCWELNSASLGGSVNAVNCCAISLAPPNTFV